MRAGVLNAQSSAIGAYESGGPLAQAPSVLIWPGFAVDTAFHGGLAFVLWSAPGFVRREVRRRRGRCVRCGYELKGLAACPECGGAA